MGSVHCTVKPSHLEHSNFRITKPRIPTCHNQLFAFPDSRCPVDDCPTCPSIHPLPTSCSRPCPGCGESAAPPWDCPGAAGSTSSILLDLQAKGSAPRDLGWELLPARSFPNFGKSLGDRGCAQGAGFMENTWMGQEEDLGFLHLGFWLDFFPQGLSRGRIFRWGLSKQNLGSFSLPCVLFSFGHSLLDLGKSPGSRTRICFSAFGFLGYFFFDFSTPDRVFKSNFSRAFPCV